jgi:hypothetical protein
MGLFTGEIRPRNERLETAIDAIRDRFGRGAVGSASMVTEEGIQVPARRDAPWGPDE